MLEAPENSSPMFRIAPDQLPAQLGEYLLLKQIHEDNRLRVYWAFREDTVEQQAVVSVLSDDVARRAGSIDKLRAQASWLVSRLHGNLVQFLDVGQAGEAYFFISELIEGRTLRRLADAGRSGQGVGVPFALQVGAELSRAVQFIRNGEARQTGLVTPAPLVSPRDVLITTDGSLKLLHHGLVMRTDVAALTTLDPLRVSYLPPEMAQGASSTEAADVFCLAALVWELIGGRSLADEKGPGFHFEQLSRGGYQGPSPIQVQTVRTVLEKVQTAELLEVLMACLSPDPADRPATLDDFAGALATGARGAGAGDKDTLKQVLWGYFGAQLREENSELAQMMELARRESNAREKSSVPSLTMTNFDTADGAIQSGERDSHSRPSGGRRRRRNTNRSGDLPLGEVIPGTRYRVFEKLGEGAWGPCSWPCMWTSRKRWL